MRLHSWHFADPWGKVLRARRVGYPQNCADGLLEPLGGERQKGVPNELQKMRIESVGRSRLLRDLWRGNSCCLHQLRIREFSQGCDLPVLRAAVGTAMGSLRRGSIRHQFSRLVADKIFESKRAVEGEKKLVTVLFADVADYGELSGKLKPEEIFEVLDHCFELMADRVLFYGGTVGQFAGKRISGCVRRTYRLRRPRTKACRAALAIQQQMEEFGRDIRKRYGIRFQMLLGLNSGHILVGSVEDDLTMDYSDIGNTSNIAFKVKCAADPGTAFLSENTYKLTEGFFIFGESGRSMPVAVPPLKLYKLVAESPYKTAFDVRAKRGLTPFVDRDLELKRLKDSFELAAQGKPLCLAIVAESGIGKSRLLHEFRKSVVDSKARYLELKCLSHSRGVAYHPFIDFLKNSFSILDTDDNDQIRLKVKSGLKPVLADDSTTLPFLLELLSVRESGIDSIP